MASACPKKPAAMPPAPGAAAGGTGGPWSVEGLRGEGRVSGTGCRERLPREDSPGPG